MFSSILSVSIRCQEHSTQVQTTQNVSWDCQSPQEVKISVWESFAKKLFLDVGVTYTAGCVYENADLYVYDTHSFLLWVFCFHKIFLKILFSPKAGENQALTYNYV